MDNWDKRLLFLSTFLAPFYFILPTNFSIYEIVLLLSALIYSISRKDIKTFDSKLLLFLSLMLIGYTMSAVNSVSHIESLKFPVQFGFILLIQSTLILSLTKSKRDLWFHAMACMFSLFVLSMAGIIHYMLWFDGNRFSSVYNNPNTLGQILYFLIVGTTVLLYEEVRKRRFGPLTIVTIISLILGLMNIILTQSRASIGVLAIYLLLFTTTKLHSGSIKSFLKRLTVVSILSALSLWVLSMLSLLPSDLISRFQRISNYQSGTVQSRIQPVRVSIRYSVDNYFLGAGYNNYVHYVEEYAISAAEARFVIRPHNLFFSVLSEGGLLAALGIFGFVVTIYRRLIVDWFNEIEYHSKFGFGYLLGVGGYFGITQVGIISILRVHWLFVILSISYLYVNYD